MPYSDPSTLVPRLPAGPFPSPSDGVPVFVFVSLLWRTGAQISVREIYGSAPHAQ